MNLKEAMKRLSNAHGVSGNELEVSIVAKGLLEPFMDRVAIDEFGNVTGYRACGKSNAKKVMIDAHIDQVGYIVRGITEEGFLRFTRVAGGVEHLLGKGVSILTRKGKVRGIVSMVPSYANVSKWNKPEYMPIEDLLIDIGMTGEQARKAVAVGDYIVWDNDAVELQGSTICGKATDDRACFLAIAYAMELLMGQSIPVDLIVTGSTKEEVDGHGAKVRAYRDQPDMIIAVDVGGPENYGNGPVIPTGPVSRPFLAERLKMVARGKNIPFICRSSPGVSGTNANHFQIVDTGFTTAFISMPQKYIHTPAELVTMRDIELTGKLLAEFVLSLELPLKEVQP